MMIVMNDACAMDVSLALALALASVINYVSKWCHNLERHWLLALESSFTIVTCL